MPTGFLKELLVHFSDNYAMEYLRLKFRFFGEM